MGARYIRERDRVVDGNDGLCEGKTVDRDVRVYFGFEEKIELIKEENETERKRDKRESGP